YCNFYGYRLPTEANAEFASMGGVLSDGFTYSGSNDPNEVAWHMGNSGNQLHAVGQKMANELGLHDMAGNVWEWCEDWYAADYYAGGVVDNPAGPSSGDRKVLRGGSYLHEAVSSKKRHSLAPDGTENDVGFRVAY